MVKVPDRPHFGMLSSKMRLSLKTQATAASQKKRSSVVRNTCVVSQRKHAPVVAKYMCSCQIWQHLEGFSRCLNVGKKKIHSPLMEIIGFITNYLVWSIGLMVWRLLWFLAIQSQCNYLLTQRCYIITYVKILNHVHTQMRWSNVIIHIFRVSGQAFNSVLVTTSYWAIHLKVG